MFRSTWCGSFTTRGMNPSLGGKSVRAVRDIYRFKDFTSFSESMTP